MVHVDIISLSLALSVPFIFGLMNVIDKFAISHKVKNPLSFVVISGIINILIGSALGIFLEWNSISSDMLIFPVLAGIIFGLEFFFYYYVMSKEDVSRMVGLMHVYPIFVALLSFLFLDERLSLLSYIGMMTTITGAVLLSLKSKRIRLKVSLWTLLTYILVVASYELLIKVSSDAIPTLNGIAVTSFTLGLTIQFALFKKKIRKGFPYELKNIRWAIISEILTVLGLTGIYFSMTRLPATMAASIFAVQPLSVLILESIAHSLGLNISIKNNFKRNLIPIALIVLGVIILTAS